MWAPTVLTGGGKADYGFGWELAKVNGSEIVRHGGGINDFAAGIERAPGKGLTVIVLTNSDAANATHIASRLLGFVEPELKMAQEPAIEDGRLRRSGTLCASAIIGSGEGGGC